MSPCGGNTNSHNKKVNLNLISIKVHIPLQSVTSINHNFFSTSLQSDAGWEEYYDYIFPEDAANQPNLKLLAMAKMWKRQQITDEGENDPEKGQTPEDTSSPSSDEPATPPENLQENNSDQNNVTETRAEKINDRDDDDDVSSTSSESDSDEEKNESRGNDEEKKESRGNDEDKD